MHYPAIARSALEVPKVAVCPSSQLFFPTSSLDRIGSRTMTLLEEYLAANKAYLASGFHQPQKLGVKRKAVIITCMDSRIFPERLLGLNFGDAEVIRNGSGRVTEDVIRSMIVCQDILDCNQVFVIHHTDCGGHAALYHPAALLEHAKAKAKELLGIGQGGIDMHPVVTLEGSVREDVAKLRASDKIKPTTQLYGLVLDTESGALREVCKDVREGV